MQPQSVPAVAGAACASSRLYLYSLSLRYFKIVLFCIFYHDRFTNHSPGALRRRLRGWSITRHHPNSPPGQPRSLADRQSIPIHLCRGKRKRLYNVFLICALRSAVILLRKLFLNAKKGTGLVVLYCVTCDARGPTCATVYPSFG